MKRLFFWKSKPQDEQSLLAHYRQTGDMDTLAIIFDRYLHLLYGVCLKYLANEQDAEDMCMQLFEKLSKELRQSPIDNLKAWLHTVARNQCLLHLRKAAKHTHLPLTNFTEADEEQENNASVLMENPYGLSQEDRWEDLEESLSQLEEGIEQLPDEQKVCIRLFYIEQRCYKDIAEATGYELSKVKSYLQNGKRNLKLWLEKKRKD